MKHAATRSNTKEAQLERLIYVAQGRGLTIHEIVLEPKRTSPLGESPEAEDPATRWLREQAGRRA
jgi:hypothetical protein